MKAGAFRSRPQRKQVEAGARVTPSSTEVDSDARSAASSRLLSSFGDDGSDKAVTRQDHNLAAERRSTSQSFDDATAERARSLGLRRAPRRSPSPTHSAPITTGRRESAHSESDTEEGPVHREATPSASQGTTLFGNIWSRISNSKNAETKGSETDPTPSSADNEHVPEHEIPDVHRRASDDNDAEEEHRHHRIPPVAASHEEREELAKDTESRLEQPVPPLVKAASENHKALLHRDLPVDLGLQTITWKRPPGLHYRPSMAFKRRGLGTSDPYAWLDPSDELAWESYLFHRAPTRAPTRTRPRATATRAAVMAAVPPPVPVVQAPAVMPPHIAPAHSVLGMPSMPQGPSLPPSAQAMPMVNSAFVAAPPSAAPLAVQQLQPLVAQPYAMSSAPAPPVLSAPTSVPVLQSSPPAHLSNTHPVPQPNGQTSLRADPVTGKIFAPEPTPQDSGVHASMHSTSSGPATTPFYSAAALTLPSTAPAGPSLLTAEQMPSPPLATARFAQSLPAPPVPHTVSYVLPAAASSTVHVPAASQMASMPYLSVSSRPPVVQQPPAESGDVTSAAQTGNDEATELEELPPYESSTFVPREKEKPVESGPLHRMPEPAAAPTVGFMLEDGASPPPLFMGVPIASRGRASRRPRPPSAAPHSPEPAPLAHSSCSELPTSSIGSTIPTAARSPSPLSSVASLSLTSDCPSDSTHRTSVELQVAAVPASVCGREQLPIIAAILPTVEAFDALTREASEAAHPEESLQKPVTLPSLSDRLAAGVLDTPNTSENSREVASGEARNIATDQSSAFDATEVQSVGEEQPGTATKSTDDRSTSSQTQPTGSYMKPVYPTRKPRSVSQSVEALQGSTPSTAEDVAREAPCQSPDAQTKTSRSPPTLALAPPKLDLPLLEIDLSFDSLTFGELKPDTPLAPPPSLSPVGLHRQDDGRLPLPEFDTAEAALSLASTGVAPTPSEGEAEDEEGDMDEAFDAITTYVSDFKQPTEEDPGHHERMRKWIEREGLVRTQVVQPPVTAARKQAIDQADGDEDENDEISSLAGDIGDNEVMTEIGPNGYRPKTAPPSSLSSLTGTRTLWAPESALSHLLHKAKTTPQADPPVTSADVVESRGAAEVTNEKKPAASSDSSFVDNLFSGR